VRIQDSRGKAGGITFNVRHKFQKGIEEEQSESTITFREAFRS